MNKEKQQLQKRSKFWKKIILKFLSVGNKREIGDTRKIKIFLILHLALPTSSKNTKWQLFVTVFDKPVSLFSECHIMVNSLLLYDDSAT